MREFDYDECEAGNPLTIQGALILKHNCLLNEIDRLNEEINLVLRMIGYIRDKQNLKEKKEVKKE